MQFAKMDYAKILRKIDVMAHFPLQMLKHTRRVRGFKFTKRKSEQSDYNRKLPSSTSSILQPEPDRHAQDVYRSARNSQTGPRLRRDPSQVSFLSSFPTWPFNVALPSPLPYGPETSFDGSRTIFECFQKSAMMYGDNPCLGYRPINPDGSAQDYVWVTYKEVYDNAVSFGFGLMHLGLCPPNGDGLEGLGFFAKNRPEWVIGEQGCYSQGIVPVPLYDTLGAESVEYVVRQTEIRSIMCTSAELDRALAVANVEGAQLLDFIVLMDAGQLSAEQLQEMKGKAAEKNVKLYGLMEVVEMGRKNPAPFRLPRGKDVAFFCYTSGTTGNPKGALITHTSFISCLCGIRRTGVDMYEDDVHLSYLPLPHVFERGILTSCLAKGAAVGFYQGDPLKILDDLQALRPTVFPSVPRLLNRIYDKILQGVDESGGIKKWLFNKALTAKTAGLRNGTLKHSIWDAIVFGPLKKRLGFDRTRIMMTGSAPISGHVLDFLRAVFGCPVTEGYGQTESSLAVTTTEIDDFTCGHVGLPLPCNDIRLEDVPEMGYLTKDTEHSDGSKCLGRGEVCFRGANNFAGYYRMPEKTEETIDSEDWVHTGDVSKGYMYS